MLVVLLRDELGEADDSLGIVRLLVRLDRPSHALLGPVWVSEGTTSAGGLQGVETLTISDGDLVILRSLQDLVEVLQRLGHLVEGDVAAASLVEGEAGLVDVIGVGECLRGILVRSCGHQQVARVDVHHRVFLLKISSLSDKRITCVLITYWLYHNQLLEIHEGHPRVADQVCAFASV